MEMDANLKETGESAKTLQETILCPTTDNVLTILSIIDYYRKGALIIFN